MTDEEIHVISWLHLDDREKYGDQYDDGSAIAWSREVRKSVSIGPSRHSPELLSRSAPITEDDARGLLEMSDTELEDAIYAKLGVTSRLELPGLPKGPYYDPIDLDHMRAVLRQALENTSENK